MRYERSRAGRTRRGAVAALVALCLTVLVGIVALVIDGGMLFEDRRHAQLAADAAAFAGAIDLSTNYSTNQGLDPKGTAKQSALTTAAANGFTTSNSTITVNIPPKSGPFNGVAGHVEVIIQYTQQRYFSAVWGSGNLSVYARGVARGQPGGSSVGLYVMAPTGTSLDFRGNGDLKIDKGAIYVNSTDAAAISLKGNGNVSATEIDVRGKPGVSGNGSYTGTLDSGVSAMQDPFASLPTPDPTGMTTQTVPSGSGTITLQPGRYVGDINLSGDVVLEPGIYYVDGGTFDFGGNTLTGTGVMIYATNGGGVHLSGKTKIDLSAPTSGPYAGIAIYQDRGDSASLLLSGQADIAVDGAFYAIKSDLTTTGQGAITAKSIVVNSLTAKGNGSFTITPLQKTNVRLVE